MFIKKNTPTKVTFDIEKRVTNPTPHYLFFSYPEGIGELCILPRGTIIIEKNEEVIFLSDKDITLNIKNKGE